MFLITAACTTAATGPDGATDDAPSASTDSKDSGRTSEDKSAPSSSSSSTIAPSATSDLARRKAEMLTSIWENGTTILQYGYCENIDDGRGYTSGRAGFCSGTGDAVLVVKCMAKAAPNAKVAKYIPALDALTSKFESSGKDQASTSTLDKVGSYCADWASDAANAAFKTCQDQVVHDLYFAPAQAEMTKHHLASALTLAALYDAEINHGDEGDDGVAALAERATKQVGTADESKWLEAFLTIRLSLLASNETWADSVDRVALYESLRRDGNFDLSKPITTNVKAASIFSGKNGLRDSEYPSCTIAADGSVSGDADCTNATPATGDDDDDDDN